MVDGEQIGRARVDWDCLVWRQFHESKQEMVGGLDSYDGGGRDGERSKWIFREQNQ